MLSERNLHLHRVALEKLRHRPGLKERALALVERWLGEQELDSSHPWLEEWRAMLTTWALDRIEVLVLDEERGQTLRQGSPLAVTPEEARVHAKTPSLAARCASSRWATLSFIASPR